MSSTVEFVTKDNRSVHGLGLIEINNTVWVTFAKPWWDLASWFWYWLAPGDKKWVQVRKIDGTKIRIRAIQLSNNCIRLGRKE